MSTLPPPDHILGPVTEVDVWWGGLDATVRRQWLDAFLVASVPEDLFGTLPPDRRPDAAGRWVQVDWPALEVAVRGYPSFDRYPVLAKELNDFLRMQYHG